MGITGGDERFSKEYEVDAAKGRDMTSEATAIEVYWRPGCGFCMALDRALTKLDLPVEKRNIWEEPEAAAFVRSHANGNETVPTVAVGEVVMVNPRPADVIVAMADQTPHLLPEGVEPPEPGRLGQAVRRLLGG